MTRSGPACRVHRCRTTGTTLVPLGQDTALDVLVCGPHALEIEAAPAAWKMTALPPKGREISEEDQPVLMRVGEEPR